MVAVIVVVLLWLWMRKHRASWAIGMMIVGLVVAYTCTMLMLAPIWAIELGDDRALLVYPPLSFPFIMEQVRDYAMDTASIRIVLGWPDGPTFAQFTTLQGSEIVHFFRYNILAALMTVGFASLAVVWGTIGLLWLLGKRFPVKDPRIGRREDLGLLTPLFLIVIIQGFTFLGLGGPIYSIPAWGVLVVMTILALVDWDLKGRHTVT